MTALEKVISVAKSAGAILAHEFSSINKFETKGEHDIVTHAPVIQTWLYRTKYYQASYQENKNGV